MAGTIGLTIQTNYENGNASLLFNPGTVSISQTNQGYHSPVVTVNSSAEEDFAIGDVGTNGVLTMRNLDVTNYVTYGPKDTTMTAFGRIEAGEVVAMRLEPGVTMRWQANTAACNVQVTLYED